MKVADFDYDLPAHFIAQTPAEPRDTARLMRLERGSGAISHHKFADIAEMLLPGDVLVMNDTRVIPARLPATKAESGGKVEILLLRQQEKRRWLALVGGRNIRDGMRLLLADGTGCTVLDRLEKSQRLLEFDLPIRARLPELGEMPLPPYIQAELADPGRYQTVYARRAGSAAAPTAGLHFTPALLERITAWGLHLARCTLHIGLDTFQPVTAERVIEHKIHSEFARLDAANAQIINNAKRAGGRVIAVGTTSARTLESAAVDGASEQNSVRPFAADTSLFIYPGYRWRAVDGLITNFHLPRSSLLMMLSAFVGRERLLAAYEVAKRQGYRFYSFGDCMFIC
ncbi:MAG: tRNA preQ1(34) S-adenosylmethionine ribosyltransferase-isomerase QueA [Chloroflexi bacterium]|nr:tRNA preQ1(34) S-adenosylmethionine ribosyltransferase-isomerase QueA [Chloroflexota bacterium]MDE2650419.1 tRNA preQ1(34) S-adenosylmethionine ribosyltransferase-isomerase QueA [Chloroflexota bacterium]